MLVLMSLFITGVHANEDQTLIKDTPFVSGQAFKKGFSGMTTQPGKLRKKLMRLRSCCIFVPASTRRKD
jgi:hypothetical protein